MIIKINFNDNDYQELVEKRVFIKKSKIKWTIKGIYRKTFYRRDGYFIFKSLLW